MPHVTFSLFLSCPLFLLVSWEVSKAIFRKPSHLLQPSKLETPVLLDQTGSSDHTFSYQPDRYHLVPKLLLLLSHITPHSYTFSRSVLASQTRSNEGLTHTTSHIFSHQISFSSLPLKHASSIFTTHTHIHNVSASIKLSQAHTILSLTLAIKHDLCLCPAHTNKTLSPFLDRSPLFRGLLFYLAQYLRIKGFVLLQRKLLPIHDCKTFG